MTDQKAPRLRGVPGSSPLLLAEHKSRLPTVAGSPIAEPVIRTQPTLSSFLRGPKPPAQGWAASDTSAYDVDTDSKQNGDQAVTERVPYEKLLEIAHRSPAPKPATTNGGSRLFKTVPPKPAAEGRAKASMSGIHVRQSRVPSRRVSNLQQQAGSILDPYTSSIISPGPDHTALPCSPTTSDASPDRHILSQSVVQLPSKISRGSYQQHSNDQVRRSSPHGQVAFGRTVNNTPNRRQPHPPSSPVGSGSHPAIPNEHLLSQCLDHSDGWPSVAAGGLTPEALSAARSSAIPGGSAIPNSHGALNNKDAFVRPAAEQSGSSQTPTASKFQCRAKKTQTPDHVDATISSTSTSTPTGILSTPLARQSAPFRTPSVQPSRIDLARTPEARASTTALSGTKPRSALLSASLATSPAIASTALASDKRKEQAEQNAAARIASMKARMAQANRGGAHQAGAVRASTGQLHPPSPTKSLGKGLWAGVQGPTCGGAGSSSSSSNSTLVKLREAGTAGILQTAAGRASVTGPLGGTATTSLGCSAGTRAVSRVRASMPASLLTVQQQSRQKHQSAKAAPASYPHPELSTNTRLQVRGPAGAYKVAASPASRSARTPERCGKASGSPQSDAAGGPTPSNGTASAGRNAQQEQAAPSSAAEVGSKGASGPPLSPEISVLAYADMDLVLPPSLEASGLLTGSNTPPLLHRNLSQELIDESSAGSLNSVDSSVAIAAKSLAPPTLQLGLAENSASPPKHRRSGNSSPRGANGATSQPLLKRMASGVMLGQAGQGETAAKHISDAAAVGKGVINSPLAEAVAAARTEAGPHAAPPSVKPAWEPHHRHNAFNLQIPRLDLAKVPVSLGDGGDENASEEEHQGQVERQRWSSLEPDEHHLASFHGTQHAEHEAPQSHHHHQQQQRHSQRQQQLARGGGAGTDGLVRSPHVQEDPFEQAVAEVRGQAMISEPTSSSKGHRLVAAAAVPRKAAPTGKQISSVQGTARYKAQAGNHKKSASREDASQGQGHGLTHQRESHDQGVPAASSRRSATEEEEPEAFYVYPLSIPAEECNKYDEVKKALSSLRGPQSKQLLKKLDSVWENYQEARRNCEAMAFRGHRLLDQVSNEFTNYKKDTEEKLEQVVEEANQWKEQADHALAVVPASGLELLQKQRLLEEYEFQIQELQAALALSSGGTPAQEAKARAIAGSATTSILFQKALQQQAELLGKNKAISDLKAALLLVCGVLKRTGFVSPDDPVRASLPADMVSMIDIMISSTQVEEVLVEQAHSFLEGQHQMYMASLEAGPSGASAPDFDVEQLHAGAAYGENTGLGGGFEQGELLTLVVDPGDGLGASAASAASCYALPTSSGTYRGYADQFGVHVGEKGRNRSHEGLHGYGSLGDMTAGVAAGEPLVGVQVGGNGGGEVRWLAPELNLVGVASGPMTAEVGAMGAGGQQCGVYGSSSCYIEEQL